MKNIKKLLLDLVPVMFGVILALMVNDCRDDRRQEKLRQNNLLIVEKRMDLNIESLEDVIINHEDFVKFLEDESNDNLLIVELLNKNSGFMSPIIKNLSTNSFTQSMSDFNLSLQLESIATSRLSLQSSEEKLSELITLNANKQVNSIKDILRINLMFHLHLERTLLEQYLELQDLLSSKK